MTGELYAVQKRQGGMIHAVFSSEGLAITHHAKLGLLDGDFGHVPAVNPYIVVPLLVDEAAKLEPRYWASYAADAHEPQLVEEEIEFGCDVLAASLPAAEAPHVDDSFASFNTYGWSREEAIAAMKVAVEAYMAQWYKDHDPEGASHG